MKDKIFFNYFNALTLSSSSRSTSLNSYWTDFYFPVFRFFLAVKNCSLLPYRENK